MQPRGSINIVTGKESTPDGRYTHLLRDRSKNKDYHTLKNHIVGATPSIQIKFVNRKIIKPVAKEIKAAKVFNRTFQNTKDDIH